MGIFYTERMRFLLFVLIFFSPISIFALSNSSYVGYWKTFDTSSPKARSVIKVVSQKGYYIGRIVKRFGSVGELQPNRCVKCRGKLRNRPMIGLPILWIHRVDKKSGKNVCQVLNPHSGKIYDCRVKIVGRGKVMKLHPFVGIPLFGVTLNWLRTKRVR